MVAYHPGNAANVPAAATTSQTSLPSQSGPMVAITARRPASSRPTTPCSMPTPKSNPSRTKNPTHSTVRTRNQKATRVIGEPSSIGSRCGAPASVADFQLGRPVFGPLGRGLGSELAAGEACHESPVDDREHAVQEDEDGQTHDDGGGAHARRGRVRCLLQALHDPRLPAVLGEHPSRGVDHERQGQRPDGDPEEPPRGGQSLAAPQPPQADQQDQAAEVAITRIDQYWTKTFGT